MRLSPYAALALLLASTAAARADTIKSFSIYAPNVFYGEFGDYRVETGTLVIDTTLGSILSFDADAGGLKISGVTFQNQVGRDIYFYSSGYTINEIENTNTLVGFTGLNTYFFTQAPNDFYQGTLTEIKVDPSAVTPEPSSVALLATGLIGVAGALKRRFA